MVTESIRQPARPQGDPPPAPSAETGRHHWLLFVHQLPVSPSNLRVRTWRRLLQIGAVPIKQAVYALPDTPGTREDFEWLKTEVIDAGGDATVFAADSVDAWADDTLVEAFRRARQEAFGALAEEIDALLRRASATKRPKGTRKPAIGRLAGALRERLAALERIDFFGSAGRDRVVALLAQLDDRRGGPATPSTTAGGTDPRAYANRLWVTRPRPGVDRMSSAWLIRRFIDPHARFDFAADRDRLPAPDAVPFDMFGVEFSHHGGGCTFETLCAAFNVTDRAVGRLAEIIHDLDLKDGRFGAPDAATIGTMIDGLQLTTADDHDLLGRGMALFESLYLAFAQSERTARPRPVAKPAAGAQPDTRRRRPAAGPRRR